MRRRAILVAATVVCAAGIFAWNAIGATGPALPLRFVRDIPLTGAANRLDYASFDVRTGDLWLAHMGDGAVEAVDPRRAKVRLTVPIAQDARVRGILAVGKTVYAAAEARGSLVALDARTGRRLAETAAGDVDGIAFDPHDGRVFVSDESGGNDVVIDARSNRVIARIALGGEAGNTQFDERTRHIFVGVQTRNELIEIDPTTTRIVRRFELPGCQSSHSVAIDAAAGAAYIACQLNARLVRLDLKTGIVTSSGGVGLGVDVLALDPGLHRLYAASESGIISVYDVRTSKLVRIAQAFLALHAHVVAVDPHTHRVYFPLQDVGGKPVLRVMEPR